ncbi:hypothetical protein [Gemmatimonas sp.]
MLDTLTTMLQPWADLYAASAWLPTAVIAVHVVAMFLGGGIAIGADRRVLQAVPGSSEAFLAVAADLHATHRIVIGALAITVASGAALFASDVGTFWGSWVFWTKMACLLVLVLNGVRMRRTEAELLTNARNTIEMAIAGPDVTGPWQALRGEAWTSLAGWFAVVVLGVVVANV